MYYKQNSQYRVPDICSQKRKIFILKMKDLNQIYTSSNMFYQKVVQTKNNNGGK